MTIRPETDQIIEYLNSLVAIDPYAIAELLCIRVPCNNVLADHPTVEVQTAGKSTFIAPGTFRLGVLGLLNGYCESLTNVRATAEPLSSQNMMGLASSVSSGPEIFTP
jgi:hypothetical protein